MITGMIIIPVITEIKMTLVAHICAWCTRTLELEETTEIWPFADDGYVETHTICEACASTM
jgi:hypothetical protein